MVQLKKLTPEGIERALAKVERYRLLNEPWEAESICRDVLALDPENQSARISLLLSMTDQFGRDEGPSVEEVRKLLPGLAGEYEREYYAAIICERRGTSLLARAALGSGGVVYRWLLEAMSHYERAEELRPPGNDDALLRWNTCARLIDRHDHVREPDPDRSVTLLE